MKLSRKPIYQIIAAVSIVAVPFFAANFMAMIGIAKDAFEYIVIYHIFITLTLHAFQTITVEKSDDE